MSEECSCKHEATIASLQARDQQLMEAIQRMDAKMDMILLQISKVAVLEANHDNHKEAISRVFTRIETLETSHRALEKDLRNEILSLGKEMREFINTVNGMARMAKWVWGLLGTAVFAMFIKVVFFAASHGMTP